jgi:hypothetical protein
MNRNDVWYRTKFETPCIATYFEWRASLKYVALTARGNAGMSIQCIYWQQSSSGIQVSVFTIFSLSLSPNDTVFWFLLDRKSSALETPSLYRSLLDLAFWIPLTVRSKPDTKWCVTKRNGTLANWFLPLQRWDPWPHFPPARTPHNGILSDLKMWVFDIVVGFFQSNNLC